MRTTLLLVTQLESTVSNRLALLLQRIPLTSRDTVFVQVHSEIGKQWSVYTAVKFVRFFYAIVNWMRHPATFRILTDFGSCQKSTQGLIHKVDSLVVDCEPSEYFQRLQAYGNGLVAPSVTFINIANVDCSKISLPLHENAFLNSATDDLANISEKFGKYKSVAIGGTFDHLHIGHELLLTTAAMLGSKLTVGVTTDAMHERKSLRHLIEPLDRRLENVQQFLKIVANELPVQVLPISNKYGPTIEDAEMDCLVVSEETVRGAVLVNRKRAELVFALARIGVISNFIAVQQLPEMDIVEIKLLRGPPGSSKLSSTSRRQDLLGELMKMPKDYTNARPYVIGLTGGIASGKSTIASYLAEWGAHVVNCDRLGHAAYESGTSTYHRLIKEFGLDIVHGELGSEIDRSVLGKIVFADATRLNRLNEIVWPEIVRLAQEEINNVAGSKRIVVLEAAVLLDAGWQNFVHEVWLAYVSEDEAIKRVIRRIGCSHQDAKSRLSAQRMSDEERFANAHVVFCSQWEAEYTRSQVLWCTAYGVALLIVMILCNGKAQIPCPRRSENVVGSFVRQDESTGQQSCYILIARHVPILRTDDLSDSVLIWLNSYCRNTYKGSVAMVHPLLRNFSTFAFENPKNWMGDQQHVKVHSGVELWEDTRPVTDEIKAKEDGPSLLYLRDNAFHCQSKVACTRLKLWRLYRVNDKDNYTLVSYHPWFQGVAEQENWKTLEYSEYPLCRSVLIFRNGSCAMSNVYHCGNFDLWDHFFCIIELSRHGYKQ